MSLVNTWTLFVNISFLATEEELFSVEKQREIDEQQKITLTLQLRDKDKENETLKQSLQGN